MARNMFLRATALFTSAVNRNWQVLRIKDFEGANAVKDCLKWHDDQKATLAKFNDTSIKLQVNSFDCVDN